MSGRSPDRTVSRSETIGALLPSLRSGLKNRRLGPADLASPLLQGARAWPFRKGLPPLGPSALTPDGGKGTERRLSARRLQPCGLAAFCYR